MRVDETGKRYGIIRQSSGGRTWYHAKSVGVITTRRAQVWTTADRDAAIRLCGEVGGTVCEVLP